MSSSPKQTKSENFFEFVEEGIVLSREDIPKNNKRAKSLESDFLTELVHGPKKSVQIMPKSTENQKSTSKSKPKTDKEIKNKSIKKSKMSDLEQEQKHRKRTITFLQKTRKLTCLEKVLIPILILYTIVAISLLIYFSIFNTEKVHGTVVFEEDVSMIDLNDQDSEEYKQIQAKYQKALAASLGSQMTGLRKVNIKGMRPGSLIVDFDVDVDRSKNSEVCNNVGKVMSNIRKDGLTVDGKQVKSIGTFTGEEGNQTVAEDCTNLLPGIEGLQLGYDLKFLNIDDLSEARKRPIIKFECFHGRNKEYHSKTFQMPSAILSHISDPRGALNAQSTLIRDSSDLQKSYGWSVGVSGKYRFVTGSASVSYSSMKRKMETNERKYIKSEIKEFRANVQLQPAYALNLHENFATDLRKLPRLYNDISKSKYEVFLQNYGTHYLIEAKLGGKLSLNMSMEYNYESTTSRETWEQTASLLLEFGANNVQFDQSYSQETMDFSEKLKREHKAIIEYHGGSKDLGEENKVVNWQPTVALEPVFVRVETSEISELVKDQEKKTQLEKAISEYLNLKDGYNETDGFLDTGYGQPCRRFGDCKVDVFNCWKGPSRGFYVTGQCTKRVCICYADKPGVWSVSQKTCLPHCDSYHESKFVAYPSQGFYQPDEGVDTYLEGEGVTPSICAAECIAKWPTTCVAFVFFTNERKCQYLTFGEPDWEYNGYHGYWKSTFHAWERVRDDFNVSLAYWNYDGPFEKKPWGSLGDIKGYWDAIYIPTYHKKDPERFVKYREDLDLYKRACQ